MRRTRAFFALALTVLLVAGALVFGPQQGRAQEDQSYLASLISRALSTPATRVSIGAVEGALSSDATIRNIVISDRDGVWLRLDRARLVWRRTALLLKRLEIDQLEIGTLEILRKPLPAEEPVPGDDQPILPELPVKLQVKSFTLQNLVLGEPVLGLAARMGANGSVELGPPSEGLNLQFDARRLDAPGTFSTRLSYVPDTDKLDLKVALDEPNGGFISKLAGIPNEPPVTLDLTGGGTLDAFNATLAFDAGPTVGAKGQAQLRREGGARRLGLDLSAQIAGLLPAPVAPVFPGTTQLNGDMRFNDAGGYVLSNLSLVSQIARLDAKGTYGADSSLDFAIQARAVHNDGGRTKAGEAEIARLVFDGTLTGTATQPKIAASLDLADARLPEGRLGKLAARFTADPTGAVTDDATRIRLAADIDASGLSLSDEALARAIGDRITMKLRGETDLSGNGRYETIEAKTPSVDLSYSGDLGRARVHGTVVANAPDLSRFGEIAGVELAGRSHATIALDGEPRYNRVSAVVNAETTSLRTGVPRADALLGTSPRLTGTLRTAPRGRYEFEALRLTGAHVSSDITGFAAPDDADLTAAIDLPELKRADARLTGAASLRAHLTNGLDHPNVTVRLESARATALDRPIEDLLLTADLRDLRGALSATANLSGRVDRKPASGDLRLAKTQDGGWRLETVDLRIGSATLTGSGAIGADNLARGKLSFAAADLDDLSAIILTKLQGRLSADIALATENGRQNATITADGSGIKGGGAQIRSIKANTDFRDIYSRPVVDGTVSIDEAQVAGESFSAIRFTANGATDASDLVLSAKARGFSLDAAARLVAAEATRLDLSRLVAQRGGRRIALAGPARVTFRDGGVELDGVAVDIAGGRLSLQGRAGNELDLTVNARAIPLSAADIFVPGLGLSGTLQGEARLKGPASAPTGPYRVEISRLVAPQLRSAGIPPLSIDAKGELQGRRATVEAAVNAGSAGRLTVSGAVPFAPGAPLDLAVRGRLDAAVANATLGPAGRRVTGNVAIDMKIAGTQNAPRVSGSANLTGGTFRDTLQGVQLSNINARLRAEGETLVIESASASTPRDGRISASGRVRVDPAAGFPGEISIRGQRAALVSNSLVNATADLALDLSGPLARTPRISGRVDLTRVDVAVPDRLPTTLRPIQNTRHIAPPPQAAKRLAAARRAKAASGGRNAMFVATLDLAITAPNRIFVRGRGLDVVLGGSLRLTGTTADPVAVGAFDLARGRLAILGKRLTFSRGRLSFTGNLTPEVDFVAETQAGDVTAMVTVTGAANEPSFAFSSQPDLPQDEVLSRILFSQASGGLSPFQALQLAQVASQFAGGGGGDDSFERLRKSLGVDSLDIQTGPNGPSVGISRALSERLSVGVKAGATPDQSGLSVDLDVTKRLRVQSEVGADGSTSVGVGAEWEY